jgi:hypothetical protein
MDIIEKRNLSQDLFGTGALDTLGRRPESSLMSLLHPEGDFFSGKITNDFPSS